MTDTFTNAYTLEEPENNVRHYLKYRGQCYSMTLQEAKDAAEKWRLKLPFMMHLRKCRIINTMPHGKPRLLLHGVTFE